MEDDLLIRGEAKLSLAAIILLWYSIKGPPINYVDRISGLLDPLLPHIIEMYVKEITLYPLVHC